MCNVCDVHARCVTSFKTGNGALDLFPCHPQCSISCVYEGKVHTHSSALAPFGISVLSAHTSYDTL